MKIKANSITNYSNLLHDLTVIKDRDITVSEIKDDYTREECLFVANAIFGLGIPEVFDINSTHYLNEVDIIKKMVKCVD